MLTRTFHPTKISFSCTCFFLALQLGRHCNLVHIRMNTIPYIIITYAITLGSHFLGIVAWNMPDFICLFLKILHVLNDDNAVLYKYANYHDRSMAIAFLRYSTSSGEGRNFCGSGMQKSGVASE